MDKREYWKKTIQEQRSSGKSIAAYCHERGIRPSQFWYWSKDMTKPTREQPQRSFVPVGEQSRIEISLKGGILLRLPADCGVEALRTVLEAIDAVSA